MSGLLRAVKKARVKEDEKQLEKAQEQVRKCTFFLEQSKKELAKYEEIPHPQASGDVNVKPKPRKTRKGV